MITRRAPKTWAAEVTPNAVAILELARIAEYARTHRAAQVREVCRERIDVLKRASN